MLPTKHDSGTRMTPSCQALEEYSGGFRATGEAMAHPGEWITVYQLRPLELIVYLLGIPFRPYHPVKAIIYDPHDRCYWSLPAAQVPGCGDSIVHGESPVRRFLDRCPTFDAWLFRGSELVEGGLIAAWKVIDGSLDRLVDSLRTARQS
jgi:hypothetical protein